MIPAKKLTTAVESYLTDLRRLRASGGATGERSSYVPLANLLNAIGGSLKPKVFCVIELADHGSGHPDMGLYAAKQVRKGEPREGQIPERGVVEVKSAKVALGTSEVREQVNRYWSRYRLVLVTNLREFELVGRRSSGDEVKLETFSLAATEADFERLLERPRASAQKVGRGLGEYLARALSHQAALADPQDLAWLLASYARDGLERVERAGDSPSLGAVRSALEEALGVRFEGERGTRFFHSTLVQTLFYGVFSAWVLWSRQASRGSVFDWRTAVWHLRAPVLRALFQQLADPGRLGPLGLIEVLDWTAAALNRVDRPAFFASFNEGEAVPYFYEPFLQAFDPALRKQLGVWYTPTEVVQYMVARVDKALRDDLAIPDGLAADNVYVLDPCCGTGAYLAEVLKRIAANLEGRGLGALAGARVKQAATERVFGFEIMPAPFVIAHLQVGLTMQDLDAPLVEDGSERAGVFLTNALTGWEPRTNKPLPFPELEEERDRAERVKQKAPILVILGNPPYNGFPGVAVGREERELTDAYRFAKGVRQPEGHGLNDLYVRFFRMAERRIAERTGQGIVCFISNYSWLDGMSFTAMRERYVEAFDVIRIDCLNGDSRKTGKIAPDGSPDPSIFSTESNPVGIQVGTAVATLVRKAEHAPASEVRFRQLWGQRKRKALLDTAAAEPQALYEGIGPSRPLGLPFIRTEMNDQWFDWPALPDLFPISYSGVKTHRDSFLVDTDLDRLKERVKRYFDSSLSHDEIERRYPGAMKSTDRFDARAGRDELLARGGPVEDGFCRFMYRPFDSRWLYWEADTKLLDEKRADYRPHVWEENLWFTASQHLRKDASEPQALCTTHLGSHHLIERGANLFPAYLREDAALVADAGLRPNVSREAQSYLNRMGATVEGLFHFVLATLHDAGYRTANADGLRLGWPRIPLPGWPDCGDHGAVKRFAAAASRGRQIARLLDPDASVVGVTLGDLPPETAVIAVPTWADDGRMTGDDFAVTAGWGRLDQRQAVMPGAGRAVERSYTAEEQVALGDAASLLGESTFDVWLNSRAFWRNVPAVVWQYRLGGYQVLKKWLSYRERPVLGRPLDLDEVQHFMEVARRVSALLCVKRRGVFTATE
ncbi:MAG: N-6 DNA methylase [Holophagales bacterium]|nr:N-6 DNA methylase [Holophagales bacterium]MYG29369.1 N-6 DNA methylase [Holophagales bacterium]MYI80113.1 N-6 DNA methylase [Holophagales bacterium]